MNGAAQWRKDVTVLIQGMAYPAAGMGGMDMACFEGQALRSCREKTAAPQGRRY